MNNIFSEIESEIIFNEEIVFDEGKIRNFILNFVEEKLKVCPQQERGFCFEGVIYDFFEYIGIKLIKSNKTRDGGIDGIIKFNIDFLGEMNLGLQIKNKLIDSTDIDLFLSALKNFELQLGVIICKDSRNLEKYELNYKIRAILFSKGITIKERLIKDKVNINPVFVMRFDDAIEIVSSNIRSFARAIYKK